MANTAFLLCLAWSFGSIMAGMYFENRYIAMKSAAVAVSGPTGLNNANVRQALWMCNLCFRTGIASLLVTLVAGGGLTVAFARRSTPREQGFDVIQ